MKTGVHAIIQKINLDARQHGDERYTQLKNDIDNEIDGENTFYREELDKRREMLIKHNELEYMRIHERLNSRLHRELLTYQRDLLNEIFDMAVYKLRDASEKDFLDMFRASIRGLKGSFTLYLGALSEGKLDIGSINESIEGNSGLSITLSPEVIPFKSGFVLADERVEYNCLFEDLIEDKKNEQAAAVLKEVFMEG